MDQALRDETLSARSRELYLSATQIRALYQEYVRCSLASDRVAVPDRLEPDELPRERYAHDEAIWFGGSDKDATKLLRMQQFLLLPYFKNNVMAPRLFDVFQDEADGMSFNAFVVMMSALSPTAPVEMKKMVAFRFMDFDNDGAIGKADVRTLLEVTTGLLDLWTDAAERLSFLPPPGPKVVPGWPKSSFPPSPTVSSERAGDKKPLATEGEALLRDICTDMAGRLFASINLDGSDSLTELEFEKSLNKVPDLQKNFSVPV